jgi:hypothetical protein
MIQTLIDFVIASGAKQSRGGEEMDRFVALAPRNDDHHSASIIMR